LYIERYETIQTIYLQGMNIVLSIHRLTTK